MARGIWKGNISFGLVNIPVAVVGAENKAQTLDFDLIDRNDHAHVGYQKINKSTGKPVKPVDVVKALKLKSGQHMIFEAKELEKLKMKGTSSIDIQQFVGVHDVDPLYFDRPYYLEPDKKGVKTYVLLRETLRKKEKYAVGLVVLHTRQHLALIGVSGPALTLQLIRYAADLKSPSEYEIPKEGSKSVKISPREFSMAEKLVDELSAKWVPKHFKDTYFQDVMKAVKKKSRTKAKIHVEEAEAPAEAESARGSKVLDLMPLLERSLKSRGHKAPAKKRARAAH